MNKMMIEATVFRIQSTIGQVVTLNIKGIAYSTAQEQKNILGREIPRRVFHISTQQFQRLPKIGANLFYPKTTFLFLSSEKPVHIVKFWLWSSCCVD